MSCQLNKRKDVYVCDHCKRAIHESEALITFDGEIYCTRRVCQMEYVFQRAKEHMGKV